MKIYIEILVIFIPSLILFLWWIWYRWSLKRLKNKYNPDNDPARQGELNSRAVEGTSTTTNSTSISVDRPREPEGRQLLQEAVVSDVGKNSSGVGNFFKRLRRNKR